jgi:hypothetical protein
MPLSESIVHGDYYTTLRWNEFTMERLYDGTILRWNANRQFPAEIR